MGLGDAPLQEISAASAPAPSEIKDRVGEWIDAVLEQMGAQDSFLANPSNHARVRAGVLQRDLLAPAQPKLEELASLRAELDGLSDSLVQERSQNAWQLIRRIRWGDVAKSTGTVIVVPFGAAWMLDLGLKGIAPKWLAGHTWILVGTGVVSFLVALVAALLSQIRGRLPARRRAADLDEKIESLSEEIRQIVQRDGIGRAITEIVNELKEPTYETVLKPLSIPIGLSINHSPTDIVNSRGKRELEAKLRGLEGGSIGIAGPRGVGKSTLLRFVSPLSSDETAARPGLRVIATAPVKYQAEEFIIYLFAQTCLQLLGPSRAEGEDDLTRAMRELEFKNIRSWRRLSLFAVAGGIALMLMAGELGFIMLRYAGPEPSTQGPDSSLTAGPRVSAAAAAAASRRAPGAMEIVRVFGISPGPPFLMGFVLLALGVLGWTKSAGPARAPPPREQDELKSRAMERLRLIRYQMKISSSMSGEIAIAPWRIGRDRGLELSYSPLSFPETVQAYVSFLDYVARELRGPVIICIDELDKIATDEDAQQFINQIKAVFDANKCYFLITVSENAISSFQRRGLPFRDAFDSAFDDVLYLDYLHFSETKTLIQGRVVGLPVPFIQLTHVLSGGLARDVLRICQDLNDIAKTPTGIGMDGVCRELFARDLRARLRGLRIKARQTHAGAPSAELFKKLRELERACLGDGALTSELLLRLGGELRKAAANRADGNGNGDGPAPVADLCLEIGVYLAFCSKVMSLFDRPDGSSYFQGLETNGVIDDLARVKQAMADNTQESLSLLESIQVEAVVSGVPV